MLLGARTLLGTKGIATRSKDASRLEAFLFFSSTLLFDRIGRHQGGEADRSPHGVPRGSR